MQLNLKKIAICLLLTIQINRQYRSLKSKISSFSVPLISYAATQ